MTMTQENSEFINREVFHDSDAIVLGGLKLFDLLLTFLLCRASTVQENLPLIASTLKTPDVEGNCTSTKP